MSHQVIWTKRVTEFFLEMANLNDVEKKILLTRISGMTRVQQSFYFNMSVSTIDKIIAKLKRLYDEVQKEYPNELKPRRNSVSLTYMDEH